MTPQKRVLPWVPVCALALAGFFAVPKAAPQSAPSRGAWYLAHTLRAELLVANPGQASDRLAAWAEEKGGYYVYKTRDQVTIRFPSQEAGALREELTRVAERVVTVDIETIDLRDEIDRTRSRIRGFEEILRQNMKILDGADVKGTLAIEQEILRLVQEIEGLKGRLAKLENDRRYGRGEIYLRFRERSIPTVIPSSFGWINTVDFYRFMEGAF